MTKVITEILNEDFDHVEILDVQVRRETDSDGDEVLRIYVIFEGSQKDVDARKLAGAVRHLRPRLMAEFKELAFPLFSFISKADVGPHKFEPA